MLDIGDCYLVWIPSEIGVFLQLKYLLVVGEISELPSSIGSLANLETLFLESLYSVSLPDTFWNLRKLRHLHSNHFCFSTENLEDIPGLYELQSCSGVSINDEHSFERLIRKFPNIRRLKCCWLLTNDNKILVPDFCWKKKGTE